MISDSDLVELSSVDEQHGVTAFKFYTKSRRLLVLDQLKLPEVIKYEEIRGLEDGFRVIKTMMVRGAPCIAAVGCFSLVTHLNLKCRGPDALMSSLLDIMREGASYLIASRPTAVNLRNAMEKLLYYAEQVSRDCTVELVIDRLIELCIQAVNAGQTLNKSLGDFGSARILRDTCPGAKLKVLTHCNTGALATVGYGTALGVIRSLHRLGRLERAYCTETRPYNQGSRLTAWELVQDKIPGTLIADSMVAYLMANNKIDAVVVGADCVALNGDTANKIGTLQIAVLAKHYGVQFYVAAPSQSISRSIRIGREEIKIEQRPANELRNLRQVPLAPDTIDVWNPCFDVTPAELISGLITEFGVSKADEVDLLLAKIDNKGDACEAQLIF